MRRKARGFSLVETLVALAILGIGLAATFQLFGHTVRRAQAGRSLTAARMVAMQVLERLRLEVRHDAEPDQPTGSVGGEPFRIEEAWRAERLPWRSVDEAVPGPGAELATCNPAGTEDGVAWRVGPFPIEQGGVRFWICYGLHPVPAGSGFPPGSQAAAVKVLWRSPAGFRAQRFTSILASG